MNAPRRALVCAPLLPEFDREGGSRRLYHFIEFLLSAGWDVTFICENAGTGDRYLHLLRQRGVATWVGFGKEAEAVIAAGRFDVAIIAFWHLARAKGALIRRLSPDTRIVVESVDLHWLRNARRVLGDAEGAGRLDASFATEMIGELNAYADADGVLTVSEKEAQLISDVLCRPGFAAAAPDCESLELSTIGYGNRKGILFVGNFRHPPNVDAVEFLCQDVVPLLPEDVLTEHPLLIVGNALGDEVERLAAGHPGIRTVGWVPEVEPYLHSARVSVVPLRYGAGTKRKLLQAMMSGTPTVSTGIGVEGLDIEPDEHVLVADDPVEFADKLTRLLEDELLWRRVSKAARARVLEGHGREVARDRFLGALDLMADRRPRGTTETPEQRESRNRREQELEKVRVAARKALPTTARVLVISRGDPELLQLEGRRASHFPQDRDGGWAGFHPRDGRDALERLELLRSRYEYLLIPGSAFWWLEHYTELARHLNEECSRVWFDDGCAIYEIRKRRGKGRRPAGIAEQLSRGRKRKRRAG